MIISLNFLFIIIEKFNSFYLDKILLIICIEKQWSTRHTDCLSSICVSSICLSSICVSSMSALFMTSQTRTSLSTIQWATNDHLPPSHKKSHRREKNRDFSIFQTNMYRYMYIKLNYLVLHLNLPFGVII